MVDFSKSDKMIKISRKVDKPSIYNGFSSNITFFIQRRTFSTKKCYEFFYILAIEEMNEITVKI